MSPPAKLRNPVTVHKEVGLLSSTFNMAYSQKGLTGRYAIYGRFAYSTGHRLEVRRADPTGTGSLQSLDADVKWVEVDGEYHEVPRDCFIVVKSKNGKSRVIPLNAEARLVAVHQLSDATVSQFVFPGNKTKEQIKEVKKGFAGVCRKTGIPYGLGIRGGITFHTLRHWFST